MKGMDVERIRPRQVQVYLLGSEMGGNAHFETAKTTLACWGSCSCLHQYQSYYTLGTSMCIQLSQ